MLKISHTQPERRHSQPVSKARASEISEAFLLPACFRAIYDATETLVNEFQNGIDTEEPPIAPS